MSIKAWRGVAVGAFVALVVPVVSWIVAAILDGGLATRDQLRPAVDLVNMTVWISLFVLGPLGIVIAGRSAGVKQAATWVVLLILALPVFAMVWFLGVATLGGATGNPF